MNHKPYHEWMQAVLDGALAPADRRALEAHLADCASCQATWTSLSTVHRLFKAEAPAAPRPGFSGRFQARLAQRRSRPRVMWGALGLGLGAVAASALVVPLGVGAVLAAVRTAAQPATSLALMVSAGASPEKWRRTTVSPTRNPGTKSPTCNVWFPRYAVWAGSIPSSSAGASSDQ